MLNTKLKLLPWTRRLRYLRRISTQSSTKTLSNSINTKAFWKTITKLRTPWSKTSAECKSNTLRWKTSTNASNRGLTSSKDRETWASSFLSQVKTSSLRLRCLRQARTRISWATWWATLSSAGETNWSRRSESWMMLCVKLQMPVSTCKCRETCSRSGRRTSRSLSWRNKRKRFKAKCSKK